MARYSRGDVGKILFMKLCALLGLLPAAAALGYCNDKDPSCAHWGTKGESAWSSCRPGLPAAEQGGWNGTLIKDKIR